jgi:ADP-ribose pyrophosphatase YjhB (NUDIX family)
LPATHLIMEESPDQAAERIANEWAGVRGIPKFVMVQSHLRPSGRGKSRQIRGRTVNHWDICFVYELRTRSNPVRNPWWNELRFLRPTDIAKKQVGRGHKDVLRAARYL